MTIRKLLADCRGATAVEFAFAMPILITIMLGTLQFATALHASGALRHGLGEGIRYAKVYPGATETEVLDHTRAGLAGLNPDRIETLTFQRGTLNGAEFGQVSIDYRLEPLVPFIPVPAIVLSETKFAYLPDA